MPRPDLFRIRDWTTGAYAYRAELYAFAPDPIVSPRPVVDEDPGLPETWWKEMVSALDALADAPPPADREAVREGYLRRVIPEFTGHQVDDVTWTTAHSDLHYGNITRGPHILDWEGWGRAPYGYDAATLSLVRAADPRRGRPRPDRTGPRPGPARGTHRTADRVRPDPQDRIDFYAELASPVREHLAHPPVAAHPHILDVLAPPAREWEQALTNVRAQTAVVGRTWCAQARARKRGRNRPVIWNG
ncbi:hypothetical protein [Streptomyces sp. NPDC097981]|uniref:hypothetical protein n=1 Tax=Streptomyces sp. NPDC097981 TaxID=3155428 RepID=UPI00332866CB